MRMCQPGKMLRLIMLASLLSIFGCAQQMKSVQTETTPDVTANGEIKGITVSEDASKIDITSDRPIVYTYYQLESPPRIVVDLAQVTSGSLTLPIDVNRGSVKRIDVTRHEFGTGVLSRVDIGLNEKVEVVAALAAEDTRHLTLSLSTGREVQKPEVKVGEGVAPTPVVKEPVKEPAAAETTPVKEQVAAEVAPVVVEPSSKQSAETVAEKKVEVPSAPADKIEAVETAGGKPEPSTTPAPPQSEPAAKIAPKVEKTAGPRELTAITGSDDGISIILTSEADSFNSFKLSNPERLVVDLPKTKNGTGSKTIDINRFNLGKARIGGSPDKLRVVFDAAGGKIPAYTVGKSEAGLAITFGEAARKATASKAGEIPRVTETPGAVPAPATEPVTGEKSAPTQAAAPDKAGASRPGILTAVEFTQEEGLSRITLKTTGSCTVSEPVRSARGLYISMKGCRLPAKLQRPLDTKGFTSVIREVVPYAVKSKVGPETRIAVNLRGQAPNTLKRDTDLFVWEFREPVKITKPVKSIKGDESAAKPPATVTARTEAMEKEFADTRAPRQNAKSDRDDQALSLDKVVQPSVRPGKQYTGRKVSLEFSDADIRKIFQLIAEVSNQNFLISDDVSGTISLKLVNVPWDQALDVILENKGLGMQKDGNIVQIRPKTKMKSLDDEAIELRLTEERKMPLSTVIFDVNFATLGDIKTQFMTLKSKRNDSSISADVRTNKIIVVDIDPNIRKMRALLESLDVPEKQVMIEARIVEASANFARDIGVKWNFRYVDGSASVANINNATSSMGGVVTNVLPTGTTGGIAAGMAFGKLLSNIQLDMRLSAASTVGHVKIISTPKVLTVNNKAAKISQGQMVPYQNTSSTEGAKTEFIEAALSLEVTPHITADGSVNMKIKASNNSVGSAASGPPPINKKEATSELVVKNGETTVIGGIYVDSETEGNTGVPFLSDIPLLGWLFKSNSINKTKNELLIFITPKIVG